MERNELSHLLTAMRIKQISTATIAALIGTTEKTAYNKLHGESDFSVPEALKIHENMFPEYSFSYLFQSQAEKPA